MTSCTPLQSVFRLSLTSTILPQATTNDQDDLWKKNLMYNSRHSSQNTKKRLAEALMHIEGFTAILHQQTGFLSLPLFYGFLDLKCACTCTHFGGIPYLQLLAEGS